MARKGNGDSQSLDPVTVEVVRNKLDGIANEMEMTLLKSSFSPIVKEGMDASASLFTLQGETLAQAIAVPIHLATLIPIVKTLLQLFPVDTMRDGDVYIMNDPYLGGTHLPDIALVAPIFHRGRPIALSATMTHHQDVGGLSPGSVPTNATEIFQEGLRIPPLKFRDAGKMNETLVAMIRQNVRLPDTIMGDLNAQIAGCTVGARRLADLAESLGENQLLAIFETLLDRSEAMTRKALAQIPRGTYRYVDYMDNDGIELDKRIKFEVAVTVDDDGLLVDFTGTSPQVRGPFNCVPSGSRAAAYFSIRAITDPSIPTNGGCFRPVRLKLPEGSVVNPREPAPVNSRTSTIKRVTGCILGAFQEVLPDRVPAPNSGELLILMFGGTRRDGSRFVCGEMVASGSGAGRKKDGIDVVETDATNCMNQPVEALEMDAPIRVHRTGVWQDSGGPGSTRGGLGIVREVEVLHGEVSFTHRGERHFTAARGVAGGQSGAMASSTITRLDGRKEEIPSKLVTTLKQGDRVLIHTAGGAGQGDPKKRDRDKVRRDVADGKVSAKAAREVYGLAD
ncbi:MAG: hydantoinase B/oxoprolinase family protein [Alphaproteobacteria bacterium]|nr:hydantoinase B/oxoprolinase family protein [Alphaproteobacteria bacterium]